MIVVRSSAAPLTTTEVAARANLDRGTVRTHLRLARARGLVRSEPRGDEVVWSAVNLSRPIYRVRGTDGKRVRV